MTFSKLRFITAALLAGSALTYAPAHAQDGLYGSNEQLLQGSVAQGSLEGAAGSSIPGDPAAFYNSIPREVAGEPGEILKSQRGIFAFGLPQVDLSAGKTTTVAYVSRDSKGQPIPVTGSVTESTVPWNGPGPRPTIIIAPGTQGSGDRCAPSRLQTNGIEYETIGSIVALAKGYNVAMTDLPGLGVPGFQHTYMNRVNQGNATLDMARAAINLGTITPETPLATFGYSQGGGGSAAALELAPTYAPELNIKAGYAGGVPADLGLTATAIDNGPLSAAMGYTIAGFLESNPELRPYMEEVLNDKGKEVLRQTSDECIWDSLVRHAYTDSRELTKDGRSLGEYLREEPLASLMEEQVIGNRPPNVPVYVGQGTNDDTIPVAGARQMAKNWCEAGTPVYYNEHNIPRIAPLFDHVTPMLSNLLPSMNWLDQVFRGQDFATSDCSQIPS